MELGSGSRVVFFGFSLANLAGRGDWRIAAANSLREYFTAPIFSESTSRLRFTDCLVDFKNGVKDVP